MIVVTFWPVLFERRLLVEMMRHNTDTLIIVNSNISSALSSQPPCPGRPAVHDKSEIPIVTSAAVLVLQKQPYSAVQYCGTRERERGCDVLLCTKKNSALLIYTGILLILQ